MLSFGQADSSTRQLLKCKADGAETARRRHHLQLAQINRKLVGPECSGTIDKLRAAWPCSLSECCHNMFLTAKLVLEISANIYVPPAPGLGILMGAFALPMRK